MVKMRIVEKGRWMGKLKGSGGRGIFSGNLAEGGGRGLGVGRSPPRERAERPGQRHRRRHSTRSYLLGGGSEKPMCWFGGVGGARVLWTLSNTECILFGIPVRGTSAAIILDTTFTHSLAPLCPITTRTRVVTGGWWYLKICTRYPISNRECRV